MRRHNAAVPSLTIDLAQVERTLGMLYEPGDWFFLTWYDDAKRKGLRASTIEYRGPNTARELATRLHVQGVQEEWALAVSAGAFGRRGSRKEHELRSLRAFYVDIDAKNFSALPGAPTTAADAARIAYDFLVAKKLTPHAILSTGGGIHIYWRIEPQHPTTDAERYALKDLWFKTCGLLWSCSDRHDLASIGRLPGSFNWKTGAPRKVTFIDEFTDLDRRRLKIADLEAVVGDQPKLEKKPGPKTRAARTGGNVTVVDAWEKHVLDVALALDPVLRTRHSAAMNEEGDRSKQDFKLALRLDHDGIDAAVAVAELEQTIKGRTRKDRYADNTFGKARVEFATAGKFHSPRSWKVFSSSSEALSELRESEPSIDDLIRGDVLPSPVAPGTVAVVDGEDVLPATVAVLVAARPGDGKTRAAISKFAMDSWTPKGEQTGFAGIFVNELLRHEHLANASYPHGPDVTIDDEHVLRTDFNFPKTPEAMWARMPDAWKAKWGNSLARFKSVVTEPEAFFINAFGALEADARRKFDADQFDDEDAMESALAVHEHFLREQGDRPFALAKFSPRAALCVIGVPEEELQVPNPPCKQCDVLECRSNRNTHGSIWRWNALKPSLALFTHRAFSVHQLFRPATVDFKALVFDELPDLVFRVSTFRVNPKTGTIKTIKKLLEVIDTSPRDPEHLSSLATKLKAHLAVIKRLGKEARDRAKKDPAFAHQWKVMQLDPLLTPEEFKLVHRLLARDHAADPESYGDRGIPPHLDLLQELQDFTSASNDPLDVWVEYSTAKSGKTALTILRPMNGWPEILQRVAGGARHVAILDATGRMDPRYLLAGLNIDDAVPQDFFRNTTLVLTADEGKSISKAKLPKENARGFDAIAQKIVDDTNGRGVKRLLVLTAKKFHDGLEQALKLVQGQWESVHVDHFGNVRGVNSYRECDAVYLTHLHRKPHQGYAGLWLLLHGFEHGDVPKQWTPLQDPKKGLTTTAGNFKNDRADRIRVAAMVCDLYQDIMRINLREDADSRAQIFLPTARAEFAVRLLRLFRGASVVTRTGHEHVFAGKFDVKRTKPEFTSISEI